jgi:FkbM family methyltransferase
MLRRALRAVERGFYIDVGAHDPEYVSVTKSFYDAGWRGINIEPEKECFRRLVERRPRDINLQVLVSNKKGHADFYEVQGTGLSTSDASLAENYRAANYVVEQVALPITTLDDVCATYAPQEIHFLKIDVEGAEELVLRGASFKRYRPWIVVAEATIPLSSERCDTNMTNYLREAGYIDVYFDGINSFYLAEERRQLSVFFDRPPNPFDHYISPEKWELLALRAELESIKNSLSWKLTSPLRWVDSLTRLPVEDARARWRHKSMIRNISRRKPLDFSTQEAKSVTIDCDRLAFPESGNPSAESTKLSSCLCARIHLESDAFRYWARALQMPFKLRRKLWEFCFICQSLFERGMLAPGRRGLGFAVGEEPLPALFAAMGCDVVATDLEAADARAAPWAETGQLASSIDKLRNPAICRPDDFAARVRFQPLDMNHIPEDLRHFDFTWSSCSFEHCGSIQLGLDFLINQMRCLRPGGVAVHTTEFNLSSNEETIEEGRTVIFRKRDIDRVIADLESDGHHVEAVCYQLGKTKEDRFVDVFPYGDEPHLKLLLEDRFVSTSIGLIMVKGDG